MHYRRPAFLLYQLPLRNSNKYNHLFFFNRQLSINSFQQSFLKLNALRVLNPAENIKSLPPASFTYASLLATSDGTCKYTKRVLPTGFMLRFIKAEDELTGSSWLVSDQIIGPKRNGYGIWLSCSHNTVKNYINERIYANLGGRLKMRPDLADHIITLFSIRIYNQISALPENVFTLIDELSVKNTINNSKDGVVKENLSNSTFGCFISFMISDSEENNIDVYSSKDVEPQSWLESYTPTYHLMNLLEHKIYKSTLSLPQIQNKLFHHNSQNNTQFPQVFCKKIGIEITPITVPLMVTLFRASAYISDRQLTLKAT